MGCKLHFVGGGLIIQNFDDTIFNFDSGFTYLTIQCFGRLG